MNGLLRKIKENQFIIASVAAIIAAIAGVFIVATLAPVYQGLAVMNNKVEAYEVRMVKLEDNSVTKEQSQATLDGINNSLTSIDRRLGIIEGALIK